MGQVLIEGGARGDGGLLQLDHHQRQAVDEADQVRPAGIELAGDAELADEQEIVAGRVLPIDQPQALDLVAAVLPVRHPNGHALLQQLVDFAIGRRQAHGGTVARQLVKNGPEGLCRQTGIEPGQGRLEPSRKHHLAFGLALQQARRPKGLVVRRNRLPSQRREQPDSGLFDELVFGVGVGHGYCYSVTRS